MKQTRIIRGVISLIILSLSSCQILDFGREPTPTPQSVPSATNTLPVKTPIEEETQESPTPTETQTVPSDTPEPEGLNTAKPYLIYGGRGGVWISNPDGRFLTQIYQGEYFTALEDAVSPDGKRLALITQGQDSVDLILVNIPGGEQEHIAQLLEGPITDAVSDRAFASYAILEPPNLAWQPGSGRFLAFIGAIEGPTADLYLLDTQSGEIRQLTDGLSQAIMPTWSPNGTTILHYGVSWVPPFGGAIVGPTRMDGAWAVRVSDEAILPMPTPSKLWPDFVAWLDDGHYLSCDEGGLREIAVDTKAVREILACCCGKDLVYAPTARNLLLNFSGDCNPDHDEGLYLFAPGSNHLVQVFDQPSWEMNWLPGSNAFFAYPDVVLSADGQTAYLPPELNHSYKPAISSQGYAAWVTYTNTVPYVRVQVPGESWKMISNEDVETLIWDHETGQTLLMVIGGGRLLAAAYPDFIPREIGVFGGSAREVFYLP